MGCRRWRLPGPRTDPRAGRPAALHWHVTVIGRQANNHDSLPTATLSPSYGLARFALPAEPIIVTVTRREGLNHSRGRGGPGTVYYGCFFFIKQKKWPPKWQFFDQSDQLPDCATLFDISTYLANMSSIPLDEKLTKMRPEDKSIAFKSQVFVKHTIKKSYQRFMMSKYSTLQHVLLFLTA